MREQLLKIQALLEQPLVGKAIHFVVALIIFIILYQLVKRFALRLAKKYVSPQKGNIIKHIIKYIFYVLVIFYFFNLFGIKLTAVLGAAGIAGAAIGFAAQTSVSNIISGFFVLGEQTFQIGDFITLGTISGNVHTINLLSIKIITPDNQLVRIPHETIIKENFINNTYFPVRRMAITVSVSHDTDLDNAVAALKKVPPLCENVIKDPNPLIYFDKFSGTGVDIVLAVWFNKADYFITRNQVFVALKKVFVQEGISIPFQQIVIHDTKQV